MKELMLLGGFVHKADAIAYQRTLEEDTVLISVLAGPMGFPLTPLCYFAIGKKRLGEISDFLDNYQPSVVVNKPPQEPVFDLGEAPPVEIQTYFPPVVETPPPKPVDESESIEVQGELSVEQTEEKLEETLPVEEPKITKRKAKKNEQQA